jgi:hypothetical protein
MTDTIPTEDVREMDYAEIREQWEDIVDTLQTDPPAAHQVENQLWERRRDLFDEMKNRIDAEPPECPECSGQSWSQVMGGPKSCDQCDFHPAMEHEELIQEIDAFWNAVLSGGEAEG